MAHIDDTPISPAKPEYNPSEVDPRVANYTRQVREKIVGKDVRESLARSADIISIVASEAKVTSEEAIEITQQLIDGTFEDGALVTEIERKLNELEALYAPDLNSLKTEIGGARGKESTLGDNLNSIKTDLADEATYREQDEDWSRKRPLLNTRRKKATLALVDDDGKPQIITQLLPVVQQEQVPISIAVITERVETNHIESLTWEQLKDMKEKGFEVVSHTHTHQNLGLLADEQQHYELGMSKKLLQDHGFEHNVIVYPYGGMNATTRDIASQYYEAGVFIDSGDSLTNNTPIDQFRIQRVYIDHGVELVKTKIDEAIANESLIIVGMHCFYDTFSQTDLIEVIQYAKSVGIDIVSAGEAIKRYGNIIDLPNLQIGADGNPSPYSIIGKYRRQAQIYHSDDSVDNYVLDAVSYRTYSGVQATANAMPENRAGVLFTYRMASDDYAFQTYMVMQTRTEYRRFWDNPTKKWTDWARLISQQFFKDQLINHGTLNSGETKDYTIPSSAFQFTRPGNANPKSPLPLGIMYSYFVQSAGVGAVRLYNTTSSPINVGSIEWRAFTLEQ